MGGVFALALILRLVSMATAFDPALKFEKYFDLARQLIGHGWLAADAFAYAPGYVYFLAVLLWLVGAPWAMCLVQVVLGALSCVFIYLVGRSLFDRRTAVVAGVWAAVFGPFLLHDIEFLSDSYGMFLYCAGGAALLWAMSGPSAVRFGLAGLLIGLRAIQRPNVLLLVAFCALIIFLSFCRERGVRRAMAWCVVFLTCVLVPIAPIAAQNYLVTGDFILVTDSGGYVFYCSNNHASYGLRYNPPPLVYQEMRRDPTGRETYVDLMDDDLSRHAAGLVEGRSLSPAESSRFWSKEGMECIRRRGIGQVGLVARKVFYTFHAYEAHDTFPVLVKAQKLRWLAFLGMGTLAPCAIAGLVLTLRQWRSLGMGYALLLTPIVSMGIFYVAPRFRLDLEAMLIPFGATTLVWCYDRLARRELGKVGLLCAGMALLFVGLHLPDGEIARQKRISGIQTCLYRGHLARNAGEVYDALAQYEAGVALARYPTEAAECERAIAEVYRSAGDAASAARHEQLARGVLSEGMMRRLLPLTNDAEALFALGRHELLAGDPAKAAECLSRAAKLDPYNPFVRFHLAQAMFKAGNGDVAAILSETRRSLEYGLRFSSSAHLAYALEGECHMKVGDWAAAEEALEEAVRLAPRYGRVHALLARVYLHEGDKERASEEARLAGRLGAGQELPPELREAGRTGDRE